jgi:CheY-specific phosphatase CheX
VDDRHQRSAGALAEDLRASVQQVLATMVEGGCDCLGADASAPEAHLHAQIDFQGAHQGTLSIACDAPGAEDLARGLLMLGPDDPLAPEEVADALKECANMVAGVLKTRAFGSDGDARLSVPRLQSTPAPAGALVWRVRGGTMAVALRRGA